MPEPLALTLDAAAEALPVSPRTVPRLLDAGELGRVKIGRAVRVHAESLRAYVERQSLGLGEMVGNTDGATWGTAAARQGRVMPYRRADSSIWWVS